MFAYQWRHGSQKATDDYGQGQRLSYGPILVDCLRRFFQGFSDLLNGQKKTKKKKNSLA
jgi:hypothetical protein